MAMREKPNKQEVAPSLTEERKLRVNPKLDERLTAFMAADQRSTDYYTKLVKENPERAVRSLMLAKMFRHEDQMRLVQKQMPQAKVWVEETPGMMERIRERIKDVLPIFRDRAFVGEALKAKARMDFTPRLGTGVSV